MLDDDSDAVLGTTNVIHFSGGNSVVLDRGRGYVDIFFFGSLNLGIGIGGFAMRTRLTKDIVDSTTCCDSVRATAQVARSFEFSK